MVKGLENRMATAKASEISDFLIYWLYGELEGATDEFTKSGCPIVLAPEKSDVNCRIADAAARLFLNNVLI